MPSIIELNSTPIQFREPDLETEVLNQAVTLFADILPVDSEIQTEACQKEIIKIFLKHNIELRDTLITAGVIELQENILQFKGIFSETECFSELLQQLVHKLTHISKPSPTLTTTLDKPSNEDSIPPTGVTIKDFPAPRPNPKKHRTIVTTNAHSKTNTVTNAALSAVYFGAAFLVTKSYQYANRIKDSELPTPSDFTIPPVMQQASAIAKTAINTTLNSSVETAKSAWNWGTTGATSLLSMVKTQLEQKPVENKSTFSSIRDRLFPRKNVIGCFRDSVIKSVRQLSNEYSASTSHDLIHKHAHDCKIEKIKFDESNIQNQTATLSNDLGAVRRKQLDRADDTIRMSLNDGSISDQYQRFVLIARVAAEECHVRGRSLSDKVMLGNIQPQSARDDCKRAFLACGFSKIEFETLPLNLRNAKRTKCFAPSGLAAL